MVNVNECVQVNVISMWKSRKETSTTTNSNVGCTESIKSLSRQVLRCMWRSTLMPAFAGLKPKNIDKRLPSQIQIGNIRKRRDTGNIRSRRGIGNIRNRRETVLRRGTPLHSRTHRAMRGVKPEVLRQEGCGVQRCPHSQSCHLRACD